MRGMARIARAHYEQAFLGRGHSGIVAMQIPACEMTVTHANNQPQNGHIEHATLSIQLRAKNMLQLRALCCCPNAGTEPKAFITNNDHKNLVHCALPCSASSAALSPLALEVKLQAADVICHMRGGAAGARQGSLGVCQLRLSSPTAAEYKWN